VPVLRDGDRGRAPGACPGAGQLRAGGLRAGREPDLRPGALSLDDPVLAHLPGLAGTAAAGSETITVGHLLRMTAGNGYRWSDEDADHPGDPARDFLAAPLVAEPGSTYHYAGANTYVLGRVVHAISGLDLRDFLVPRLFGPLGIRNPQWLRCPLGFPLGAIGYRPLTSPG
jgi:CubicO group peptidase (beta-lactamase class C family)